ncbi:MAG: hypothetical protein ACOY90_13970 [Candidatus Zhuqueibacterota bacterium]
MKYRTLFLLLIGYVLIGSMSCEKNPAKPGYQKEVSVFGFLWGNTALTPEHAILITHSQPIDDYYDVNEAAISNTLVTVTDENSGRTYFLKEVAGKPGFYYNDSLFVTPKTTYLLRVFLDDREVTAYTTVPPELKMTTALKIDEVNYVYRDNLGFEKPVTLETENANQIIKVEMFCNETYDKAEYIYPFTNDHKFPEDQDEYDQGANAEPRHIQTLVNYRDLISSQFPGHVVYWYSSMIVFYGSNTMQILAIDDNYHNYFHMEHPELNGGINGGIGVFGSVCGQKFDLFVMKDSGGL